MQALAKPCFGPCHAGIWVKPGQERDSLTALLLEEGCVPVWIEPTLVRRRGGKGAQGEGGSNRALLLEEGCVPVWIEPTLVRRRGGKGAQGEGGSNRALLLEEGCVPVWIEPTLVRVCLLREEGGRCPGRGEAACGRMRSRRW